MNTPSELIHVGGGRYAQVSPEDALWLPKTGWGSHMDSTGRWRVRRNGKSVPKELFGHRSMARAIMRARHGEEVDHINGDTLDNQRSNLRFATREQNARNRRTNGKRWGKRPPSSFKGVISDNGRWRAAIRRRYIGTFATEVEAARAYDAEARVEFGAFAKLNFEGPPKDP